MKQPYVVPSTARRDLLIGIAIGLALMAVVLWGMLHMSRGIAGSTLKGEIVAMNFTPFVEKEVTFGKGGVHQIDGEYVLECKAGERVYLVTVSKEIYQTKKVGDFFFFARPRE